MFSPSHSVPLPSSFMTCLYTILRLQGARWICACKCTCPREENRFEIVRTYYTVEGSLHLQPFLNILNNGIIVRVEGWLCLGSKSSLTRSWTVKPQHEFCGKSREMVSRSTPHRCLSPISLPVCLTFLCPHNFGAANVCLHYFLTKC